MNGTKQEKVIKLNRFKTEIANTNLFYIIKENEYETCYALSGAPEFRFCFDYIYGTANWFNFTYFTALSSIDEVFESSAVPEFIKTKLLFHLDLFK